MDINYPFTSTGQNHAGKDFSVNTLRGLKKHVFVLTDGCPIYDIDFISSTDGLLTNLDHLSDETIGNSAFYVWFSVDENCVEPVRRIIKCGGLFIPPMSFDKHQYHRTSRYVTESINEANNRTGGVYGLYQLFENICQAVDITQDVEGDFLEMGVFTGSSALTAMIHMRNRGIQRKCWLMDTFEGFTYNEATASSDIIWGGTHLQNVNSQIESLQNKMAGVGQDYSFVVGNVIADPIPPEIKKLALVNVDVDLYDATKAALEKSSPFVQKGGVIMCEDSTATPALYGAFVAMSDFLNTDEGKKYFRVYTTTHHLLLKKEM
jgi:hypothetical protein